MKNIYLLLVLFPLGLMAQSISIDHNAVVSSRLRVATTNVSDAIDPTKALIGIDYSDGLGRKVQSLGYRQSPELKDIVLSSIAFDQYGRPVRETLSAPSSENSGTYKSGVTALAQSFYGEALPYSEITLFDNSPLNRTLEQYGPGIEWRVSTSSPHSNRTVHTYNETNEVRLYVADFNGNITWSSNYYPQKSLYKTISIDEQGDSSVIFKDIVGNTIESWQQVGVGQYAKTHFLYAHGDRLRAVMQPMAVAEGTGMSNLTNAWKNFVFFYRYDNRGRVIEKKIPGADPEYFVYDKWDRLVASQTGLQRELNKWSFFKYDALGREVYRGEYSNSQNRSTLQAAVVSFESGKKHTFESRNSTTPVYYSLSTSFPSTITASDIRHINYYDSYTNWLPADMSFDAGNAWHSVYSENSGDLTGTKSKKTEDGNWLVSASYFDNKNRLIQQFTQNTFGHTERTDFEYLFAGEVAKVRMVHKKPDNSSITEFTENSYDHAGRLILIKHGLNAAADTLCTLSYDELGRLSEKKIRPQYEYYSESLDYIIRNASAPTNTEDIYRRYVLLEPGFGVNSADPDTYLAEIDSTLTGATTTMGLQTINYGYHLRGMLNCVNCENGSPTLNPDDNDLFAFKLSFQELGNYDGNISGQSWRNKTTSGINNYSYSYDHGKRLSSAGFSGTGNYSTPLVEYDLNGNIQKLHRNGSSDSTDSAIDRLTYQYSGNRLLSVTDTITWNANSGDFRDGNTSGNDYEYYTNGNLKTDLNQGIASIVYDSYTNLPTEIYLTSGRWIKKYYDGSGNLLKRENSSGENWKYAGSTIYRNDTLYQIGTPEGRAILSSGNFLYEFEYRDHLGNLRLSLRDTTTGNPAIRSAALISQTADYYPFGVQHSKFSLDTLKKQKFQFSNYESEEEFDLVNINFGQRTYNPTIGRFDKMDRFSEKYYPFSNYSYGANNPINFVDVNGDSIVVGTLVDRIAGFFGIKTEFARKVEADIEAAKNDDPEVKEMIEDLERSPRIHRIVNTSRESDGNQTVYDKNKASKKIPTGTTIKYNPNKKSSGKGDKGDERTPRVGLVHEFQHASDVDWGELNTKMTPNGIPMYEVNAVNTENKIRIKTGDKKRTSYAKKTIPSELLK